MRSGQFSALRETVEEQRLWDLRSGTQNSSDLLLVTPWGVRWLHSTSDFDEILGEPLVDFDFSSEDSLKEDTVLASED
jgi:hypothetical protein